MGILFWAIILGIIPAFIAQNKGRDFIGWWIYGTLLFIVALPHSLMMKTNRNELEKRLLQEDNKKCPYCAEIIKQEAVICRYCQKDLPIKIINHTEEPIDCPMSIDKDTNEVELNNRAVDVGDNTILYILLGLCVLFVIFYTSTDTNDKPSQTSTPISQPEIVNKHTIPLACDTTSKITGMKYGITGEAIYVRNGAGDSFDKIINEKATSALNSTQFITIDYSTVVYEECTKNGWSWIRVVDPSFLEESHKGWVESKFLIKFQEVDRHESTGIDEVEKNYSNITGTNCAEITVSESNNTMSMQQAKMACMTINNYLHK